MSEGNHNSLDILGVKPIADSINKVTEASVNGATAFLRLICRPAAEEFGLLLQDRVRFWRVSNIVKMNQKAEAKFRALNLPDSVHAHPRLVSRILEEGSWVDDETLQDMWAGLLTSSCSIDGMDDSNLFFVQRLSQLTRIQAKILNCACLNSRKFIGSQGLILNRQLRIPMQKLQELTDEQDVQRLDRELDQLRSLDLIEGGFDPNLPYEDQKYGIDITPTALALHMFVRCQGSSLSPIAFFNVSPTDNRETLSTWYSI